MKLPSCFPAVSTSVNIIKYIHIYYAQVDEEALAAMGEIGARTSLRYAVQLLTPGNIIAQTAGRECINASDVEEVDELFKDAKASAKLLARSDGYLS